MADTADHLDEIVVRYPDMADAVRAAIADALKANPNTKEWGGAVFRRGDRFYATSPQSSGGAFDISITATADQPGDKLVAIYHTHPNGRDAELFSPHDVKAAQKLKVPSYIGLVRDGSARVFDPAIDYPSSIDPRRRSDPNAGSAIGRNALLAQDSRRNALSQFASKDRR